MNNKSSKYRGEESSVSLLKGSEVPKLNDIKYISEIAKMTFNSPDSASGRDEVAPLFKKSELDRVL